MKIEPIWLAENQQQIFRQSMDAMARPGTIFTIAALVGQTAPALALLATLLDAEVSLADPHGLVESDLWPMLQARKADKELADYLICDGSIEPDFIPKQGTLTCPDLSATLIIQVSNLAKGDLQCILSGPGLEKSKKIALTGLDRAWLKHRNLWTNSFPLGVDCILADSKAIMALPRTTILEVC